MVVSNNKYAGFLLVWQNYYKLPVPSSSRDNYNRWAWQIADGWKGKVLMWFCLPVNYHRRGFAHALDAAQATSSPNLPPAAQISSPPKSKLSSTGVLRQNCSQVNQKHLHLAQTHALTAHKQSPIPHLLPLMMPFLDNKTIKKAS